MRSAHLKTPAHRIAIAVHRDAQAIGEELARAILAGLTEARAHARDFLLGCPSGRSLASTYRALGVLAAAEQADLSRLTIVMMDDYLSPAAGGFSCCPALAHYSCARFAEHEIRATLNAGLPPALRLPRERLWLPDPADPLEYERRLEAAGGIDLFLIASGASDGHVAFNPPGSSADSPTRIVTLAESTRRDNLGTFPAFRSLDEVPTHGISVGLGTIVRHSRQVALVMHSPGKRAALHRLRQCTDFTSDWPASIIFRCHAPRILVDEAAAGGLETCP